MPPYVLVVSILVALGSIARLAPLGIGRWGRSRFFGDWRQAAHGAGLEVQQPTNAYDARACAVIDGVAVYAQLKDERTEQGSAYVCWVSAKSANPSHGLTLTRPALLQSVIEPPTDPFLPIGDAITCAALSHRARSHFAELLRWGGYVQDGVVVSHMSWTAKHLRSMPELVRHAVALAQLISVPPAHLAQRLAENALQDPLPDARLNNLRHLLAPQTNAPVELAAATAQALLYDAHPPVRLIAASHAGELGHDVLRTLALDHTLDITLRAAAVRAMGRPPTPDLATLHAVLTCPVPELVCAALSAAGKLDELTLLEAIVRQAHNQHESVRAAAAAVLGARRHHQTEPLLIALLGDDSADVQRASIEALGAMGSVAAVEPLLPLAANLLRPRLREAARAAVGLIQSRLGNAEAGRLSLSEPHELAGALDVFDASKQARHAGALSLADSKRGR